MNNIVPLIRVTRAIYSPIRGLLLVFKAAISMLANIDFMTDALHLKSNELKLET